MLSKVKITEATQSMSLDHSEVKPAFSNSRAIKKNFQVFKKKESYIFVNNMPKKISQRNNFKLDIFFSNFPAHLWNINHGRQQWRH